VNQTYEKSYEKRLCNHCKNAGRTRIMKTHNTEKCRINDKKNQSEELSNQVSNKAGKSYSLYHDSGTSKTMVNHTFGYHINYKPTTIHTADLTQEPVVSTGTVDIPVGNVTVEALVVPSFGKSLLSATQLSVEHGLKQVIDPWTSKSKDDVVVATGSFDPGTKLIKIDKPEHANHLEVNDWMTVHRKLGHVGKKLMERATKAGSGLIVSKNKFEALETTCETCQETKAKRGKLLKANKTTRNYEILDVIEIELKVHFQSLLKMVPL
jgi:hypothetical protein